MLGTFLNRLLNRAVPVAPPSPTLSQRVLECCMCPVCLTPDSLLSGPEGGMSINAMCDRCGTRLNLTPMIGRIEWTHGPQGVIWGGQPQTIFPTDEQIATAKNGLSA